MKLGNLLRPLLVGVVLLSTLLGLAGSAAAANPDPGSYSGNPCDSGRAVTTTVGVESCMFATGGGPGVVYVAGAVYDGLLDGRYGHLTMTVQQLDTQGRVLQTLSQQVSTPKYQVTKVGNSFRVARAAATRYLRFTMTASRVDIKTGVASDVVTKTRTYNFTA